MAFEYLLIALVWNKVDSKVGQYEGDHLAIYVNDFLGMFRRWKKIHYSFFPIYVEFLQGTSCSCGWEGGEHCLGQPLLQVLRLLIIAWNFISPS